MARAPAWYAGIFALAALVARGSAAPVSGTATVSVHIIDNAGKPVWLAEATVYGPRVLVAESVRNGDAIFPQLPAGTYRLRVVRYGYEAIDIPRIGVEAGANLTVTVRLASSTLKQIARVTVRAQPRVSPQSVGANSPSTQLSNSLVSALQSLPGVTINPNGQASIQGYSPAQTTVEINGIPVSIPGTPQNLQLFNADVFSDASVTPQAGGGGTIDFQTQSPTLAWQGVARAVLASDHGEDVALQELGTAGDAGLSFTHAWNLVSNPLEGLNYLDTSGLLYAHRAADSVNGNALQLRYEFSPDNTILANAVGLDSTLPITCTEWTGKVPCGYGPTNLQQADLQTYQLRDIAQIGENSLALSVYDNASSDDVNQTGYYVDGVHMPSSSFSDSHQAGVIASTKLAVGDYVLPLEFSTNSTTTSSIGSAFGPLLPAFISRYSAQQASTSIPLVRRPHFDAHVDLGIQSNSVGSSRVTQGNGALQLAYTMSDQDSLNASFSPGNLGTPTAAFSAVSAPGLLQFICSENIGIGTGPSVASTGATQTQTTLSWTHTSPRWSSQIDSYRNVQSDAPINATVNALSLNPALFASTYLGEAQREARSDCGMPRIPTLASLYYQVTGIASRAVYQGVDASATYYFNDSANITASYAATVAQAYGTGSPLFGPRSTAISGEQLPNVPLHKANVVLRTLLGSNAVGLFQASFWSSNNSFNLSAYTTLDAGVLITMPRGLLSVTMTNIGNVRPGPFATAIGAVPLPMLHGTFPTIAQPLMPRTLNVGYRFHVGQPEESVTFAVPNAQFQPPSGVGFLIGRGGPALPPRPPANPFEVDRQSIFCGSKDFELAQAVLNAERSYVQNIEKAGAGGHYPEAFPPLQDGALQFNFRRNGASYFVFISAARGATLNDFEHAVQPFANCAKLSSGTEQQIEAHHLFEFGPETEGNIVPFLPLYAPEVGLYHGPYTARLTKPSLPTPENLSYPGAWPSPPPNEPFAIKDWPGCSPEIRPAAEELLQAIQQYAHAYFDLGQHPNSPEGVLITPHRNGAKAWISIRTEDLSSLGTLSSQCMFVTLESPRYLDRLGLGGEPPPQLNYSPGLGLYQSLSST